MSRCDRFDREGWLGEDGLDEEARAHVAGCAECQAQFEGVRRTANDLAALGAQHQLRREARVELWKAVERGDPPRALGSSRWRPIAVAVALAAAVALMIIFLPRGDARLEFEVHAGEQVVRAGSTFSAGDRLIVRGDRGRFAHSALRVFRDRSSLVAACPGEGCTIEGDTSCIDVRLDLAGTYELLLLVSDRAIPEDARSIDVDVARAVESGAEYQLRELEVR